MRALLALALFALASCATAPPPIHHSRELIGYLPPIPGERTFFAYAELEVLPDQEPRLSALLLAPWGERQPFVHALPEEAAATWRDVSAGAPLAQSVPLHFALGVPLAPVEAAAPIPLPQPLEGLSLSWEQVKDRRYGRSWQVSLSGQGAREVVARFPIAKEGGVELAALSSDAAAFRLSSTSEAGTVTEVAPVDLLAGGRRLLISLAKEARKRGAFDEAAAHLLRAEVLGAPDEGELWFERARLAAQRGAPSEAVVEALSKAIPHGPNDYRMRARTEEAFSRLRSDEGFRELVHPRFMPGSRAGGSGG